MHARRIALALAFFSLCIGLAGPGRSSAQEVTAEAPATAEPAPPQPYPPAEVSLRAEDTRKELEAMAQSLAEQPATEAIEQKLSPWQQEFEKTARTTSQLLESDTTSAKNLADQELRWQSLRNAVAAARDAITQRAANIDVAIARLGELSERWKLTRQNTARGATALEWIDGALEKISAAQETAGKRSGQLADIQSRLASLDAQADANLQKIRAAEKRLRHLLFQSDAPPIWRGWRPEGSASGVAKRVRADWQGDLANLKTFAAQSQEEIAQNLVLLLAVLTAMLLARRRVDEWFQEDEDHAATARVFHRPVSVALLVALLASPYLLPFAPGIVSDLLGVAMLVPAIRLLPPLVKPPLRPVVYGLAFFYLSSQVRQLLDAAPVVSRLLFTLELVAAVVALFSLLRPSRLATIDPEDRPRAFIGTAMRVFLGLLILAFVLNLFGYLGVAKILATGVLHTIYAALIAYGAYRIFGIILDVLMRTPAARRLRMVRLSGASIQRWFRRILRIVLIALWLEAVLRAFTIDDTVFDGLATVFGTPFTMGSVNISLGDVATFGLVITAAFLLARFVRFVLEEDVFPRVVLQRGVPNAVSTTVNYIILLAGFILALAGAGLELSRVTLLAGAFGVGIGFGLQDVVNNFVSGLILLFERPVQVGDTIEVQGGLLGEVKRIGPRSSTVRTFDGAEVIVPNSGLISREVTNWTLSDRRRRVTVGIGVKYGTDPERVLAILREVAAANETVQNEPEPLAIFVGFGDSSLDFELRCWIPRYEEGFGMGTQLRVAIYAKLNEAGIEIPFPQRDLHVRSVDGEAGRTLRGE